MFQQRTPKIFQTIDKTVGKLRHLGAELRHGEF